MLLTLPRPRLQAAFFKLLNLQPGEERTVLLFSLYSLLMGAAVAVFYTCTTSLFLTNFDREQLPLAFVAGGAFIYALGLSVQYLQRRLSFVQVNAGLVLFMLLTVGGLLLLSTVVHSKWLYFVLFLWNRGFVFINGIVFWATLSRVFNFEQSKRLFSFIGLGDVVSSIISYLSVPLLLKLFSPDRLLGVAFLFLLLCAGLMAYIRRRYRAVLMAEQVAPKAATPPPIAGKLAKSMGRSYYSLLFLLALLPVFGLVYVEFMFSVLSKEVYPNKASLASFLGLFFGICAVIELFIKTFLYNRLISTYSIRIGIVLLPILLIFSYVLAALYGTAYGVTPLFFAYIALSRFFLSSIRRSISEPAFQVLFQPIPPAERTLLQSRIEGSPKALGTLLTGLLLLGLAAIGLNTMVELSYIFIAVLVFWAISSFRIQGEYRVMLGEAIGRSAAYIHNLSKGQSATALEAAAPQAAVLTKQSLDELGQLVGSEVAADRCRAAVGLGNSGRFYAYQYLLTLLDDPDPEVRTAAIRAAGQLRKPELWPRLFQYLGTERYQAAATAALLEIGEPVIPALTKLFNQGDLPRERQADIVQLVNQIGGEGGLRFLRASINHPVQMVRDKVFIGLTRLHHRATVTERPHLLRQLDEQVELLVWLAATRLDLQDYPRYSLMKQALTQEKQHVVPKVFNLLSVLYGNNQFDVISELITQKNDEIQGFLLELLSTILPTEVKDNVLPLFANVPLADKVRKCSVNYPQQQLGTEARLHDFINKDYNKVTPWAKAVAIRELLTWHQTDPTAILVANAVAPEPLIAETALYVLHRLNPERFAALYQVLLEQDQSAAIQLATRIVGGMAEDELLVLKLAAEQVGDNSLIST
ncbi:HEAT repeat domain-containing protein [Hymenobacter rubidus]|uniref:HEAT repeat domain-containing protein n=1 Tax=Hymenobacter rubidus TaxID=1441626 RepID=UPI00191D7A3F|nr:HEAT repeat domain-containing protein [Hymenobacter rubidus]